MHPGELTRRGLLSLVLATAGCSLLDGSRPARGTPVVVATGETQGFFFAYGRELAAVLAAGLPEARVSTVTTSGTVDNLRRAAGVPGTFGLAALDAAAAAQYGQEPFALPEPPQAVGRLFDDYVHLVVPGESPVHRIADLAGRRVSVGPAGSGSALVAGRVLEVSGLRGRVTEERLGFSEALTGLDQGRLDALFWQGGLPTGSIVRLAGRRPLRLVPLGELLGPMRVRYGPYYRAASIPRGVYSNAVLVDTIAVPDLLVTSAATDPVLVHAVLELIFDDRKRLERAVPTAAQLDPRAAIATSPLPLHEGALRYYREVKR
ncbi:TAXI family TRAP transporter solute-binding subunit [Saccharopolyspora erythraea]|uniref:TAXI family TRAP transporter solute-binding subunit n=1 Tax=Saccharopolyspora erythraea TaxID=1836 RepID=UPI001BA6804C|nr:TAXI family TRAP transporter solute-binding subunit [Saccharopolyspora erythraea]QUH03620.1 TAXI family TRAP transporter solute-binding subunit [Saccharopolyspora erythraea]